MEGVVRASLLRSARSRGITSIPIRQQASHRITYRTNDRLSSSQVRLASTTPRKPDGTSKPVVLEQPDKFRPPSHAARLKARSTTGMHGMGAAYNQGMTERERMASKKKSYPNMFPNEGTWMYWFLTTRWIHLVITMTVLGSLATFSLVTTWAKTSPFAHLIPSIKLLPLHPIEYFSELTSVWRLHLEYNTQRVAENRRQGILDAQKRRLYRRAHGMEDLDADEVSGPDVRGLVEWDDGLTNPERERGGQYAPTMIGANMMRMGQKPGESLNDLYARKKKENEEAKVRSAEEKVRKEQEANEAEEERLRRIGAKGYGEEPKRKKVYFGIWG